MLLGLVPGEWLITSCIRPGNSVTSSLGEYMKFSPSKSTCKETIILSYPIQLRDHIGKLIYIMSSYNLVFRIYIYR